MLIAYHYQFCKKLYKDLAYPLFYFFALYKPIFCYNSPAKFVITEYAIQLPYMLDKEKMQVGILFPKNKDFNVLLFDMTDYTVPQKQGL